MANNFTKRVEFNNHYLDTSYKSNILAYIMIYFYDMRLELKNKSFYHIDNLAFFYSKYKNIDIKKAKIIVKKELTDSSNQIIFYKKLK